MGRRSVLAVVVEFFGWQIALLGLVLALGPWVPHLKDDSVGMWRNRVD